MPPTRGHDYFIGLPLEIHWWILRYLGVRDQASALQTCRRARGIVEPLLYRRVFTKAGTDHNTGGLVEFLLKRPYIVGAVRFLVLDEFDPVAYRQLMGIKFPNLESIIVQHGGEPPSIEHEKRWSLNQLVKEQPNLKSCEFCW